LIASQVRDRGAPLIMPRAQKVSRLDFESVDSLSAKSGIFGVLNNNDEPDYRRIGSSGVSVSER
jgi:basic membrane lipoprotein Med (substrate-binding protein (PBP1-ABC) superfamily)